MCVQVLAPAAMETDLWKRGRNARSHPCTCTSLVLNSLCSHSSICSLKISVFIILPYSLSHSARVNRDREFKENKENLKALTDFSGCFPWESHTITRDVLPSPSSRRFGFLGSKTQGEQEILETQGTEQPCLWNWGRSCSSAGAAGVDSTHPLIFLGRRWDFFW